MSAKCQLNNGRYDGRRTCSAGSNTSKAALPTMAKSQGLASQWVRRNAPMTFAECAKDCLNEHLDGFKNAKHRQQWQTSIDNGGQA
jgi:hypothetical protein